MKAKVIGIVVFLITICCLAFTFGCDSNDKPNIVIDDIPSETSEAIIDAYKEMIRAEEVKDYDENLIEIKNCGTYSDNIVLLIRDNNVFGSTVIYEIEIDGISLGTYPDTNYIFYVYLSEWSGAEERFYNLKAAYKEGYFKRTDLIKLSAYLNSNE